LFIILYNAGECTQKLPIQNISHVQFGDELSRLSLHLRKCFGAELSWVRSIESSKPISKNIATLKSGSGLRGHSRSSKLPTGTIQ